MRAKRIGFFVTLALFAFTGTTMLQGASERPTDRMIPAVDNLDSGKSSTTGRRMTLEQSFNTYLYEKVLCRRIAEMVSQNAALSKALSDEERNPETSEDAIRAVLLNGLLSETPEIRYLRDHQDYIELAFFFHPIAGATQLNKNSALQCLLTEKRILELEAFGPSAQAWEARRDLLNAIRDGLSMPWSGGPTELPFFELSNIFERAKRIFAGREDIAALTAWVSETEVAFNQMAEGIDYVVYTELSNEERLALKAEHRETLRTWIATLRRGL
jgi:hypothetical protein